MKLHDYFNPATGQWDEAGLTADLEILRKRKETRPTEPAGADLSDQAGVRLWIARPQVRT
eukprot:4141842-Amphidinium_carterae.1